MNTSTNNWIDRVFNSIFYIFFISFPFVTTKYFLYSGTSVKSAFLILISIILSIVFCLSVLMKKTQISIPKSPIFLALCLYFLSIVVSAFLGFSLHTSFWSVLTRTSGLWYFLHLGLFLYFLWIFLLDRVRHEKLILLTVISSAIFSVLSFLGPEGLGLIFNGYKNDGFTIGNSSFAGMYVFASFLLSIYYFLQAEKKKWWMFCLPVLLLINPYVLNNDVWFGNFSSLFGEARMSTISIILSLFFLLLSWFLFKIKNHKTLKIVSYTSFVVLIVGFFVCAHSLLTNDGFLRKEYLSQATPARPIVWDISARSIMKNPVLGTGLDNFDRVFQIQYDNRLLQTKYGSEPWFDRAHNIILEQAVDNGILGLSLYLLVYFVILLSLIYVFLNTKDKKDKIFSFVLFIYFVCHLSELQTAFDTTISYPILSFMFVSAVVLYGRTRKEILQKKEEIALSDTLKYSTLFVIFVFCFWSFFWGLVPFVRAQNVNGYIRTIGSAEKRIPVYETLFGSEVDEHAFLWRTMTDFQRGISENPKILSDAKRLEYLKTEADIFENEYRQFVSENPDHFRARLNFANILIYQTLFGKNKLEEAQKVLDEAIALVPNSPQPYWMKAVGYLYMKKFDLAKQNAQNGFDLNPDVEESQRVVKYIEESIKTFPEIELFFFRQI